MPATIIEDPTTGAKEPTFEELASMIEASQSPQPAEEKKTPEPNADEPAEAKTQKPESGTDKTQHQEETEDELPENVKKRIAQEAKKQAFFQSKIDQAVSARKAKEAEAAKLTDKPGSEPAKTTESAKNERPKRPSRANFQNDAEFEAALDNFLDEYQKWVDTSTEQTIEQKLTERQAKEAQQRQFDEATKKHGAEFPALMQALAQSIPLEFQMAVSALEDWSGVAVYLAKNEAERNALVEEFKVSPLKVIAKLGKLEDRLKPEATKAPKTEETPLPKPLKPVGGAAAGSNGRVDLDKVSDGEALKEIERMLKAS